MANVDGKDPVLICMSYAAYRRWNTAYAGELVKSCNPCWKGIYRGLVREVMNGV